MPNQIRGHQIEDGGVARVDLATAATNLALGQASNLKITLSTGTLAVVSDDGVNPGLVKVPSTTGGQEETLTVTGTNQITEADLVNLGFGIDESLNYSEDKPAYLYVANLSDNDIDGVDGSSAFFLASRPNMVITPSTAGDIGDIDAIPTNDSKDVIIFLQSVTELNYRSLNCICLGAVRFQWALATTKWVFQTLNGRDGFGKFHEETIFKVPLGQNGNQSGKLFETTDGSTTLAFTDQVGWFTLKRSGELRYSFEVSDCTVNGADGTPLRFNLPITAEPITGGGSYQLQHGFAGIVNDAVELYDHGPTRYETAFYHGSFDVYDATPSYGLLFTGANDALNDNLFTVSAANRIVGDIVYFV
jgi:hypothetical protein